jgi:hypothetical protein
MRRLREVSLLFPLLALSSLSSCFLAGYDERKSNDRDAGEAGTGVGPDAGTGPDASDGAAPHDADIEAGKKDATTVDAGVVDARVVDARADAATRDSGDADTRDSETLLDAARDANTDIDATPEEDSGPGFETDAAEGEPDAGFDAALGRDAGDGGTIAVDSSTASDASVGDAGADACGPSGCVVTQTCTGSECDLLCTETPDPGTEITLDCKFECSGQNRCASTCNSGNTCVTHCTSTNVCRSACSVGAVCGTTCTAVTDCGGTCYTGSNCLFTCNTSNCTQVSCALGAACRIKCNSGNCDFAFCGNLIGGSCPDGSIVCGRLCP